MKQKMKSLLTFIVGFLIFLTYLDTGCSLELNIITVQQALVRWGILITAVIIGVICAAIKQEKEE